MNEPEVQEVLESNLGQILKACLGYNGNFVPKAQFPLENGIQADLGAVDDSGNIIALFESKGNVNINELVRGIGQVMQYQYHINKKIGYNYVNVARAFLVIPKGINEVYDFEKISFPENSGIILIDEMSKNFILMTKKRINSGKLKKTNIISPYYIRDNRLGEIYLGLKMIEAISPKVLKGKINMKYVRAELVKVIKNKGNARNIAISLHGLGFLDKENRLTAEGQRHVRMDYYEFCKNISYDQIAPFINLITNALVKIANKKGGIDYSNIKTSGDELKNEILEIFSGNDVLYLTESGTRYISSWMGILKDDLGAISFKRGSYEKGVKINYFPCKGYPFLMKEIPTSNRERDCGYVFDGLEAISKL